LHFLLTKLVIKTNTFWQWLHIFYKSMWVAWRLEELLEGISTPKSCDSSVFHSKMKQPSKIPHIWQLSFKARWVRCACVCVWCVCTLAKLLFGERVCVWFWDRERESVFLRERHLIVWVGVGHRMVAHWTRARANDKQKMLADQSLNLFNHSLTLL
jgi:hypothetical protein